MNPYRPSTLARACRKVAKEGVGSALLAVRDKTLSWWSTRNWLLGRWLELRGNRVQLGDVTLHVGNAAISTALKSLFVSGAYEDTEVDAVRRYLESELPVIELGACIGFISCVTNTRLHDPTAHVVVEANPSLIPTLEKNRDANGCSFSIEHAALAYEGATVSFGIHQQFYSSSLKRDGRRVVVPAVTLGDLIGRHRFGWINLICDIEGSESDLVIHETEVLRRHVHVLIVEVHDYILGKEQAHRVVRGILEAGFIQEDRNRCQYVFRNSSVHRSPGPAEAAAAL